MNFNSLSPWRAVGLISVLAAMTQAHAQTTPPLKPGLWHVTTERFVNGQKMHTPDLSQRLQTMPPETRKRMEDSMRQRGIDISSGSADSIKVCMTREQLDAGRWRTEEGGCKTDFSSRTASLWKWRSVCTNPTSESDGEARIESPERYSVKLSTVTDSDGKPNTVLNTMNARWLNADCGNLAPHTPSRGMRQP